MKKYLKNIIIFLLLLFIYMIPTLMFMPDKKFYDSLKGNFVPQIVFIIAWSIIFIILSYLDTHYLVNKDKYKRNDLIGYLVIMILNYATIFAFPLCFFEVKSLFLGYITTLLCAATAILLSMQSLLLDKKKTLLLTPYVIWTIFASVYSILLYLKN